MPTYYSVKLESIERISPKCWKVRDVNGTEALIPDSQYLERDSEREDSHWFSKWILERVNLKYDHKIKKYKSFYATESSDINCYYEEKIIHVPEKLEPLTEVKIDANLKR